MFKSMFCANKILLNYIILNVYNVYTNSDNIQGYTNCKLANVIILATINLIYHVTYININII